jgi:hypothetical protein
MFLRKQEVGVSCYFFSLFFSCSQCFDRTLDADEEAVDCGGAVCVSCAALCSDGVQNGMETGIDCGGRCNSTCTQQQTSAAFPLHCKCIQALALVGIFFAAMMWN